MENPGDSPTRLDAADLLLHVARHLERAGVLMRKHQIVSTYQVCSCGRVPVRLLRLFGLRCEIVCAQWLLVCDLLRRLLEQACGPGYTADPARPAVGRATVRDLREPR